MSGKGVRSETLRLIALPLSRKPHLTYYHAQRIRQAPPKPRFVDQDGGGPAASTSSGTTAEAGHGPGEQSVLMRWMKKGTDFGARQWDSLGKAPKGNWKWRIYMTGERMMDRIPFEEWALKSIDPALAPRPLRQLLESDKGKAKAEDGRPIKLDPDEGLGNRYSHMVPFVYPPSLEQPDELISTFRKSLAHREPYHRKWMKLNLYLSPLTLPFALVPVIPNLPFFYMLWRGWSHWRALKASEYLLALLARGLVVPQASGALDNVYLSSSLPADPSSSSQSSKLPDPPNTPTPTLLPDEPTLLLSKEMVPKVIEALQLGDEATGELNRAVDQAKARLKNMEQSTKANGSAEEKSASAPREEK